MFTTQKQVREAFFDFAEEVGIPAKRGVKQNDQVTTVRCLFVEFVDGLERDGIVTRQLAERVTL